jgi:molybdopterin/thiamine biosynthesis adenylyltransferase
MLKNSSHLYSSPQDKLTYTPTFYRLNTDANRQTFNAFLAEGKVSVIHDEIKGQLQELIKSQNPSIKIKADEYEARIAAHLNGVDINEYGVWVYYPWSRNLVHLLDEDEFVEVRTNRNQYKITRQEQALLKQKKIGIVGLSVGQSIALTVAMERICGEIRLADFDIAELSNLNRLRTGLHNMGINKTIIAAREILEIDPYIKVKLFHDGLNRQNMDEFFTGDGKLDLFIEVCDGLDIKIESRYKARELQIPVVMDTNDKGMLDVERFDLEPNRPVLHGLADGLDPNNIKSLTNEEKIPYILKMVGAETISTRLKASMMEVEQSINTWPQLASSVVLGGALTTDVCRRILLDQYHESGRYYVDLEDMVKDEHQAKVIKAPSLTNPYLPLQQADQFNIIDQYYNQFNNDNKGLAITDEQLDKIIDAVLAAPSAGNNQPWKWVYSKSMLFLFHDKYRSWSWGDYYEMGSHMALGTALENLHLQAAALGLSDNVTLFPLNDQPALIAAVQFSQATPSPESITLASHLYTRTTNRKLGVRQKISERFFEQLKQTVSEFKDIAVYYTDDDADLEELGEIIAECDKVRLLNELGHEEFYHEIRWSKEQAEQTKDGVEVAAVDITLGDIAGLSVAKDWKAVELLAKWKKGGAFKKMSLKSVKSASAIVIFTIPEFTHTMLIEAGKAAQKAWIFANKEGVSVHPMLSPAFFFNRMIHGKGADMPTEVVTDLKKLRERFLNIFPIEEAGRKEKEVFVMKVSIAESMGNRSLRKNKNEMFSKY